MSPLPGRILHVASVVFDVVVESVDEIELRLGDVVEELRDEDIFTNLRHGSAH